MSNIIGSDLYRIRKGAALRNALLGLFALIILIVGILTANKNGVFLNLAVGNMNDNVSVTVKQQEALEASVEDLDQMMTMLPQSGADFTDMMVSENILVFFLLFIPVAVVGADYSAGTYRNTLSFETDRKKVYLGKLVVNFILTLVLLVAATLFSILAGGIALGFSGFTGAFFAKLLAVLALQLPIYMALAAFAQCVLTLTQKTGASIAIYLVFTFFFSSIIQLAGILLPTVRWLYRLDFISGLRLVSTYQTAPAADIVVPLLMAVGVLVGATALGMARYRKADMH